MVGAVGPYASLFRSSWRGASTVPYRSFLANGTYPVCEGVTTPWFKGGYPHRLDVCQVFCGFNFQDRDCDLGPIAGEELYSKIIKSKVYKETIEEIRGFWDRGLPVREKVIQHWLLWLLFPSPVGLLKISLLLIYGETMRVWLRHGVCL